MTPEAEARAMLLQNQEHQGSLNALSSRTFRGNVALPMP